MVLEYQMENVTVMVINLMNVEDVAAQELVI
jgi:hypothetical protein